MGCRGTRDLAGICPIARASSKSFWPPWVASFHGRCHLASAPPIALGSRWASCPLRFQHAARQATEGQCAPASRAFGPVRGLAARAGACAACLGGAGPPPPRGRPRWPPRQGQRPAWARAWSDLAGDPRRYRLRSASLTDFEITRPPAACFPDGRGILRPQLWQPRSGRSARSRPLPDRYSWREVACRWSACKPCSMSYGAHRQLSASC
jgi:hypothetical protein